MNRKGIYVFVSGFVLLIMGAFVGFLIGTYIGGNYFPSFQLGTLNGYEATGWIGIIIGGLFGIISGGFLGQRWSNNRIEKR